MSTLTANDLKTGGVAAIEAALADHPEATISVRGKERFVVMELAHYHYLRECELEAALAQSRADLAAGRYVVESAQAHLARLDAASAGAMVASEPKAAYSAPRQPGAAAGTRHGVTGKPKSSSQAVRRPKR